MAAQLAVEVDGATHGSEVELEHDKQRTTLLESRGIRVLRFWNREVLTESQNVLESTPATLEGKQAR